MTNVYEALQRARKEGVREEPREPPAAVIERIPLGKREPPGNAAPFVKLRPVSFAYRLENCREAIETLLGRVLPRIEHDANAVLHIVGAIPGAGTSTIAREFAFAAATAGNRETLLIDADLGARANARFFDCPPRVGLLDWVERPPLEFHGLQPVADSHLSVAALAGERHSLSMDGQDIRAVYELARKHFALTVVDCPPVTGGHYMTLAPQESDGVLLVIQAEKVRPAVVNRAKSLIGDAGGKIVGAVFNRRKDYVPRFIYDRL
ncbi:MAG TPA: hypothetical protein VFA12_11090 [Stellaceae bacterium]|nr:hypothetical protein [Stellaceae bacterium]